MVRRHGKTARENRHAKTAIGVEIGDENDLEEICRDQASPFILILDGIQDPQNLGACLRTADAAGVHAVVAPKNKSSPLTPTAVRIACGAADSVPFIEVTNLVRTLKAIQELGVWIVGTDDETDEWLYDVNLKGGIAMVLGAEGKGMRRLTREACDHVVKVPMAGKVECLNVSVATGVCLYEAVRQRRES